ncbi:hypothetical protein [Actinoplanes sp. L3-i22]|uniref:hypothetical protein n=1 Tax=Actinoplanes sp. L3-i22 TaxID=2836373 RepID=UPI001C789CA7|nr:hypothetical protein [Actinoplanes sp. L3-i22]BCY08042.1 hypothetical protein L3i22_031300 [Actinoplanes sp. L3-i22]
MRRPCHQLVSRYGGSGPARVGSRLAKRDFLAAIERFRTVSYRLDVSADLTGGQRIHASGAHDPKARRLTRTVEASGRTTNLVISGKDIYVRDGKDERWIHAVGGGSNPSGLDVDDPSGLAAFGKALNWIDPDGPHAFKGAFDPMARRILPVGAPSLTAIGMGGGSFTATTDDAGNLTSVVVTLKTVTGTSTMTSRFSDFGKPVKVTVPKNAAEGTLF